jgi:lysophospholipid acyltransferase (LPLAT)-like uncharacterized protein
MAAESEDHTVTVTSEEARGRTAAEFKLAENTRSFKLSQRLQISVAGWIGFLAVWIIGRSMRWEVEGWENWAAARQAGKGMIYTFWHREIFPATWFWRQRRIVVMTSQNFDGEYIARIIRRHGYGAARGSSSRGARQALMEMIRCHRNRLDTAFTIDGPRGPRFVAKEGATLLAKASGAPVLCFHIALRKAVVLRKSWDQFQIPWPFSRARVFIAPPVFVPRECSKEEQAERQRQVQEALDDLHRRGNVWAGIREDEIAGPKAAGSEGPESAGGGV